MYETMQSRDGVGLAAPQVGILKRAVVIDVGDGKIELINPEMVKKRNRPTKAPVLAHAVFSEVYKIRCRNRKAQDKDVSGFKITSKDSCKGFCHEIEHLDGKLFLDRVIRFID